MFVFYSVNQESEFEQTPAPEQQLKGEAGLWAEVLLQAFDNLLDDDDYIRNRTFRWFVCEDDENDVGSLSYICQLFVGLDLQAVVRQAVRKYRSYRPPAVEMRVNREKLLEVMA